ncbi:hypothetical protein, partial [Gemmobacter aquaticus]|uniref:hypothetical protein n=1 Tax=Gemmobacter aquaticus TaxID=490185 RepID=UPI001E4AF86B
LHIRDLSPPATSGSNSACCQLGSDVAERLMTGGTNTRQVQHAETKSRPMIGRLWFILSNPVIVG